MNIDIPDDVLIERMKELGWTPPEEKHDPYKEFRDHMANGGDVEFNGVEDLWSIIAKPTFKANPKNYRCVPIPTGEALVGKLCWVSNNDARAEAVARNDLAIILEYDNASHAFYRTAGAIWYFAWPLTKAEIAELT